MTKSRFTNDKVPVINWTAYFRKKPRHSHKILGHKELFNGVQHEFP